MGLRGVASLRLAVSVLSVVIGFQAAYADFYTNVHFAALASGGTNYFLTQVGTNLELAAQYTYYQDSPTKYEIQSFDVSEGFPRAPFTIMCNHSGLYLDAAGTAVSFKAANGLPSQLWTTNNQGQLNSSTGLLLTYPVNAAGVAIQFGVLFLSAPSPLRYQQQAFILVPDVTPAIRPDLPADYVAEFRISQIGTNTSKTLCIDSGSNLTPGNTNTPILSPCSNSNPRQVIQALFDPAGYVAQGGSFNMFQPGFPTIPEWNWPAAPFRMQFKQSPGLCIGAVANLYVSSPQNTTAYILLQNQCENSNTTYSVEMDSWIVDSRGQLYPQYTKGPCLNSDPANPLRLILDTCSSSLPTHNRWAFNLLN